MLYDANETMKLLGQQLYLKIFNEERKNAFNEMMNARVVNGHTHYIDIGMDAFMLGYIYGKREERAKRKAVR